MTTKEVEWAKLVEEALSLKGSLSKIFNRFYNYSYGNQLLLWVQGVEEPVATYRKWLEMGRQVKKGSKAKTIVRPIPVYDKENKDSKEPEYVIFKPINSVFALSDTDGDELPEEQVVNDWSATRAIKALEIKRVEFTMTNGNVQGYAKNRQLAINPVAKYPIETIVHELAHIVLGHTDKTTADAKNQERDISEFQAGMVSYIVMNETEAIDKVDWVRQESRGYIQNWLKSKKPSESEIKPIFTAVDKILKAGRTV